MIKVFRIIIFLLIITPSFCARAQVKDTLVIKDTAGNITATHPVKTDSAAKKQDSIIQHRHTPKGAAIRSAILPGWGQIYNNKWWKLPIVYAAVGIPIGLYVDNKKFYDQTKYAIAVSNSGTTNPDSLNKVDSRLRPLVDSHDTQTLINTRNQVRKYMDYSILFTLVFWGVNVIDATVDAHLRYFDVSNDLSFKIRPAFFPDTRAAGISVVFSLGNNHSKAISSPRLF